MKRLFAILLLAVVLCGCAPQAPAPTETTVPTTETVPPTTTQPPPITVYPGAVEQFLGQEERAQDMSWEAEFPLEYVMIHFTSAVVNHRDDPYNMEYIRQAFIDADVSIHYIVDRDGTVYCYVPEDRRAWHAGVGTWLEDEKYTNKMNKYAIGIEVVAIGSAEDMAPYMTKKEYNKLDKSLIGFTEAQYEALRLLVADVCQRNQIPLDRAHVIGHQEFSPKKTDPGELFDWSKILP